MNNNAMLLLAKAIEGVQGDVKALRELFEDNVTFIKGMGDIPDAIGKVLMDIVDTHDTSTKYAMEQMMKSSEFYKRTYSLKYENMNIVQEWFSDTGTDVIEIFTNKDKQYIKDWSSIKVKDFIHDKGMLPTELNFEERVEFGEWLFRLAEEELGADPMCHYVLRTLYIPYLSIYYLRPFTDYPYYNDWLEDLNRYKRIRAMRDKFIKQHPELIHNNVNIEEK